MMASGRPKLDNLRCPECGERVFFATILPPGWVLCRDMGHWAGPIQDCRRLPKTEGEPLSPREQAIADTLALAERHRELGTWQDKPDAYWLCRLMEEVGELAAAMANDHDDTPEHELWQIGSIALNWLARRRETASQVQ